MGLQAPEVKTGLVGSTEWTPSECVYVCYVISLSEVQSLLVGPSLSNQRVQHFVGALYHVTECMDALVYECLLCQFFVLACFYFLLLFFYRIGGF